MRRSAPVSAAVTTDSRDPSATVVMEVAADPTVTTILNIPVFIERILTDPVNYRRKERQKGRSIRLPLFGITSTATGLVLLTYGLFINGSIGQIASWTIALVS